MLNLVLYLLSVLLILKTEGILMSSELVRITANGRSLSYITTNLSNKYSEEANYTYEDGEELDISCSKIPKWYFWDWRWSSKILRLEYYNANEILLFITQPQNTSELKFRSVLTSNNNKYYLDCVLSRDDTKKYNHHRIEEYRYRTTFYLNERNLDDVTVDHAMILSVNGQDLRVTNNIESNYDDYEFRYIDGEILHVACRKTNNYIGGSLTFTYKIIDKSIHFRRRIPMNKSSSVISINALSPNIFKGRLLTCSINNSDVPKPNARLHFVSDVPENDVRIRGLPRNNILYQYINDKNQWTIEYQYAVDETIDLICVAKGGLSSTKQLFEWEYNGNSSFAATSLLNTMAIATKQPFTKTLDVTDNAKKIRCNYIYIENNFSKTAVEIILRLKPEANMDAVRSDKLLILGSSVAAVLVILGVAGVAGWCILRMRSGNNRRSTKTSCGDLTKHKDSIKPQNDECENQYDSCYADNHSYIYCEISADVKYIDPEDHYEEIGISRCKPEIDERKTRNSLIYDEPYVHLTMRATVNTLYGV